MTYDSFAQIIASGRPIHISGIGGVSMSALARYLRARGANIRGSDRSESNTTLALRGEGIAVFIGHGADNISGAAMLIRTAAITDVNPEIAAAVDAGIPVVERAQAWGYIMRDYPDSVCIAGTHGKTTTTSMIASIAIAAGRDPTVMVGADLPLIGGSLRQGGGDIFVAEACEYKNSFLSFYPTTAIILNIDRDHLDFFPSTDAIIDSFKRFALLTPPDGTVIINSDDVRAHLVTRDIPRSTVTFGHSSGADIHPVNIALEGGLYSCDIIARGELYAKARLSVPGLHNLTNALAAAAAAFVLGIDGPSFTLGLAAFTGVGRRFEHIKSWRGASVYDDYAHHPNEISVSLSTARSLNPGRVICVFQPHTYSRTQSFMNDFASSLSKADRCIVCPIFAAREEPVPGVSSEILADMIPGGMYAPSFKEAAHMLEGITRPGDMVITMGAGDIYKLAEFLV